jgi:KRAB domain-containing zinc finger protein
MLLIGVMSHNAYSAQTPDQSSGGEKSYGCSKCGHFFRDRTGLARHMRTHTGKKIYNCAPCNQSFYKNWYLQRHMLSKKHLGKVKCMGSCIPSVEEGREGDPGSLYQYSAVVIREKILKCDTCDKTFTQRDDLTRHRRIHKGEKPHKCDLCDYASAQKCNLTRHKRTHTGEKPHVCIVCGSRFSRAGYLKAHSAKHGQKDLYTSSESALSHEASKKTFLMLAQQDSDQGLCVQPASALQESESSTWDPLVDDGIDSADSGLPLFED